MWRRELGGWNRLDLVGVVRPAACRFVCINTSCRDINSREYITSIDPILFSSSFEAARRVRDGDGAGRGFTVGRGSDGDRAGCYGRDFAVVVNRGDIRVIAGPGDDLVRGLQRIDRGLKDPEEAIALGHKFKVVIFYVLAILTNITNI